MLLLLLATSPSPRIASPAPPTGTPPQDLAAIRDCVAEFQRAQHVERCVHIPRDTRECYLDFRAREARRPPPAALADDPVAWIASALRRGLRDAGEGGGGAGGVVHRPDLPPYGGGALAGDDRFPPDRGRGDDHAARLCDELMTATTRRVPAEILW